MRACETIEVRYQRSGSRFSHERTHTSTLFLGMKKTQEIPGSVQRVEKMKGVNVLKGLVIMPSFSASCNGVCVALWSSGRQLA